MSEFARQFKVTYPDGEVVHGVQFPDGFCHARRASQRWRNGAVIATAFRYLADEMPMDGAVVEWADGGSDG